MEDYDILWIEDDAKTSLYGLVWPLERNGHKVTIAETAEEARNYLKSSNYDIIIVDLALAEKEGEKSEESVGLKLLNRIVKKFDKSRILVLSAYLDANIEKIKEMGIRNFASKGELLPSQLKKDIYQMIEMNEVKS